MLFLGGTSSEKVISLQSAQVVFQHIDSEKYNKYIVHIENKNWIVIQDTEPIQLTRTTFHSSKTMKKFPFTEYLWLYMVPLEKMEFYKAILIY